MHKERKTMQEKTNFKRQLEPKENRFLREGPRQERIKGEK